ncbi:MAG: AraC family transcriptional regulator [Clostridiales bacterium]|nr:AraC family transcriptional regulator [Clostridiales bacterium]
MTTWTSITTRLSLETVADVAGFSKYHFSRIFKECSGYNFYDYLCLLRIKAAENLLMSKEHSITEVALLSGFSSLSTFNRMFKKKKGCTPSEYRALCSQEVYTE